MEADRASSCIEVIVVTVRNVLIPKIMSRLISKTEEHFVQSRRRRGAVVLDATDQAVQVR